MAERFKLIPEVFLILVKDEKVLLSRRFNSGYEDGNYGLPAGHGEEGETMRQGTAREAKEEIGLTIVVEDLEFVLTQHRWCPDAGNSHARVGFYFVPTRWQGEIQNMEPERCDDLQFFAFDALPFNMVDHVRAALVSYRAGEKYAEFGWEKRI